MAKIFRRVKSKWGSKEKSKSSLGERNKTWGKKKTSGNKKKFSCSKGGISWGKIKIIFIIERRSLGHKLNPTEI